MAHQKLRAAALLIAILAVVGAISWAILTAKLAQANEHLQPSPKLATVKNIRDMPPVIMGMLYRVVMQETLQNCALTKTSYAFFQ